MGYSCSAIANDVVNKLLDVATRLGPVHTDGHPLPSSNSWKHKGKTYFFETGREQSDGAITGTVWVFVAENKCRRAGNLRVDPDGKIVRAPHFPKEAVKAAKEAATAFRPPVFQFVSNF